MATFLGKLGQEVRPTVSYAESGLSAELLEHARLADDIDNLTRELDSLGAQTEALARATDLLRALGLGGRLDQAIPLMNAHGQAIVYSALLTVAYIGGTGRGRGKTNSIRTFQTVAEARVYSQDGHNQG